MQWNPKILEENIAPRIHEFTSADITNLEPKYPQWQHWLTDHFLNSTLRASFKAPYKQYVINYIKRAQMCFHEYNLARTTTLEYLENNNPLNPNIYKYMKSVYHWENFIFQWGMAANIFIKINLDQKVFNKKDNSKEERAYITYNQVKHVESCIKSGQSTLTDNIPLWLSNEGLNSFNCQLSFQEVLELLNELAIVAEEFQDPYGLRERFKNMSEA